MAIIDANYMKLSIEMILVSHDQYPIILIPKQLHYFEMLKVVLMNFSYIIAQYPFPLIS